LNIYSFDNRHPVLDKSPNSNIMPPKAKPAGPVNPTWEEMEEKRKEVGRPCHHHET